MSIYRGLCGGGPAGGYGGIDPLERFTIEMAFICASEDKAGKEQKRSHSGLRRVFVTQIADAATNRWATDQS